MSKVALSEHAECLTAAALPTIFQLRTLRRIVDQDPEQLQLLKDLYEKGVGSGKDQAKTPGRARLCFELLG